MNLKQAILSSSGRDDVKSLLDELGVNRVDRRRVEAKWAKSSRSRSVSAETLLGGMQNDEMRQVCENIGVSSVATKQELIDRRPRPTNPFLSGSVAWNPVSSGFQMSPDEVVHERVEAVVA